MAPGRSRACRASRSAAPFDTLRVVSSSDRARTLETAGWYALAFWITTVLHELAHALVGLVVARGPVLHTTFVDYARDGAVSDQIATALAGPLFSGGSGLALLAWSRSGKVPARLAPFVTWLAYHGLVNLVGYVFSVSFAPGADLGRVAALLELPTWLRIGLTLAGFGLLRLVARPFGAVLAASSETVLDDEAQARAHAKRVMLAAWIATPALVLAALPVPHWLALVYTVAAPLPLFDLPDALARERARSAHASVTTTRRWLGPALFVGFVIVSRALLDGGISLG